MGVEIALPFGCPGLRVEGDQFAVDEGDVEQSFVVGGGGDVGRLAPVLRVAFPFPEDRVVIERDRVQVAELVDDVGDSVGDGRRELDQAVGVDRPVFAQGRIELALVGRQVLGPFRHPAEGRPVDELLPAAVRRLLRFAAVRVGAAAGEEAEREHQPPRATNLFAASSAPPIPASALPIRHLKPIPGRRERRTGIEPASSPWKGEALPLSYHRARDSLPEARRPRLSIPDASECGQPRGVAQSGSALGWGPSGRRFKSGLPDNRKPASEAGVVPLRGAGVEPSLGCVVPGLLCERQSSRARSRASNVDERRLRWLRVCIESLR